MSLFLAMDQSIKDIEGERDERIIDAQRNYQERLQAQEEQYLRQRADSQRYYEQNVLNIWLNFGEQMSELGDND